MAIPIRVKYLVLLVPAFVLVCLITVAFELLTISQLKISLKAGFLLNVLILIRIVNYAFLLLTLLILYGVNREHSELNPTFSFGWAMGTFKVAIFALFVTIEFYKDGTRYEKSLSHFKITNTDSREYVSKQLSFLDSFQQTKKCCGLNGYEDYKRNNSIFDVTEALNDERASDQRKVKNPLTWKDFLEGTPSPYSFSGGCNITVNGTYKFLGRKILGPNEDVPKSCCKPPAKSKCNENVFSSGNTKLIYAEGCSRELRVAYEKTNGLVLLISIFSYPWIISFYTLLVTWSFRCEILDLPFSMFGVPLVKKVVPLRHPPERSGSEMLDETQENVETNDLL